MNWKETWSKTKKAIDINSPMILTGLAVAGVFTTAYMSYKAGPKAHDILQKYHDDKAIINPDDKETKKAVLKETVKDLGPVIIPPIVMGIATSACIIGGNKISSKRIAVLSAAYGLADSKLKDYQEKMLESLGEERTQKVKEAIAKDHLKKNQSKTNTPVIMTGDGNVLCMDSYSRRFFSSNAEKIGQVINKLSSDIISDMYISLNDFYDELGIDRTPMGDDFGWNIDDTQRGRLPIYYTAVLTDDQKPCLVVEYDISPRADFRDLH